MLTFFRNEHGEEMQHVTKEIVHFFATLFYPYEKPTHDKGEMKWDDVGNTIGSSLK
jgi:hypothetical protein